VVERGQDASLHRDLEVPFRRVQVPLLVVVVEPGEVGDDSVIVRLVDVPTDYRVGGVESPLVVPVLGRAREPVSVEEPRDGVQLVVSDEGCHTLSCDRQHWVETVSGSTLWSREASRLVAADLTLLQLDVAVAAVVVDALSWDGLDAVVEADRT